MVMHWRLIDGGTGPNPVYSYSAKVQGSQDQYNSFLPAGGGVIHGSQIFFNTSLETNRWYGVHNGMYNEPGACQICECPSEPFFIKISVQNGRKIGTISDGHKVLQTLNLSNNSRSRSRIKIDDPKKYNFSICCPPMNNELLSDLFKIVPTGSTNDPYRLEFIQDPYFKQLFQAYTDLMKAMDSSMTQLGLHWRLIDAGTGTNPMNSYSPKVEEHYSQFKPGQGGIIFGKTNFFNTNLKVNNWYKLHFGIYNEPGQCTICDCKLDPFFIRVSVQGRSHPVVIFSNGQKTIKTIPIQSKHQLKRSNIPKRGRFQKGRIKFRGCRFTTASGLNLIISVIKKTYFISPFSIKI